MAKKKYKKKPESWYCIRWTGTNVEEMTSFCPQCHYDTISEKLIFNLNTVDVGQWILEDIAGLFSQMDNDQFVAFFGLDTGLA